MHTIWLSNFRAVASDLDMKYSCFLNLRFIALGLTPGDSIPPLRNSLQRMKENTHQCATLHSEVHLLFFVFLVFTRTNTIQYIYYYTMHFIQSPRKYCFTPVAKESAGYIFIDTIRGYNRVPLSFSDYVHSYQFFYSSVPVSRWRVGIAITDVPWDFSGNSDIYYFCCDF